MWSIFKFSAWSAPVIFLHMAASLFHQEVPVPHTPGASCVLKNPPASSCSSWVDHLTENETGNDDNLGVSNFLITFLSCLLLAPLPTISLPFFPTRILTALRSPSHFLLGYHNHASHACVTCACGGFVLAVGWNESVQREFSSSSTWERQLS